MSKLSRFLQAYLASFRPAKAPSRPSSARIGVEHLEPRLAPSVALPPDPSLLYQENFEGAVGAEWSSAQTSVTPASPGRRFLGEAANDTFVLRLENVSAGTIQVDFDLFILKSWDGNDSVYFGPDKWSFGIIGGPTLLDTTFSNHSPGNTPADSDNGFQAYPNLQPGGMYPAFTGAAERNTLGYTHPNPELGPMDAVYRIERTFDHAGGALSLFFSGLGLQDASDEAWGLDNVRLRYLNRAPVLNAIPDQVVTIRKTLTFTAMAYDADVPANTLTYSLLGAPAGMRIDAGTGEVKWTPGKKQAGDYAVTVRVSDGKLFGEQLVSVRAVAADKKENEVKFEAATLGDFFKQTDSLGKEAAKKVYADLSSAFLKDIDQEKVREQLRAEKSLVTVYKIKDQDFIVGSFLSNVQFSAPKSKGSIIQSVAFKITETPVKGKEDVKEQRFVEGWVIDEKGNAKGLDSHAAIDTVQFNGKGTKSVEILMKFKVGTGLYDGKLITGERGDLGSRKGVYDKFNTGTEDKITWFSPVKEYTVRFFVDNNGNWSFSDESTGVKREGVFDKERKKDK